MPDLHGGSYRVNSVQPEVFLLGEEKARVTSNAVN
jgi:hypothetical protein